MKVLIYKRTHIGDPDDLGCFGYNCCMGRVRTWEFDAVVGVGGIGQEAIQHGIDRKITWIGSVRHQFGTAADNYPTWGFEHFWLKDDEGPLLHARAPKLARRLFAKYGPRFLILDTDDELESILKLSRHAPPSPALLGKATKPRNCGSNQAIRCPPRRRRK